MGVEIFERRLLLATIPVTTASDSGAGSLRAAIVQANLPANTGSTIDFAITTGAAPFVINLATALPAITQPTTIDGTTQSGYAGTPLVEINGSAIATGFGLQLTAGNSTIKGLSIVNFAGVGTAGIDIESNSNTVQADFLGVALTATVAAPNTQGVLVNGTTNTIGGTTADAVNVIGFNTTAGVSITAADNVVTGNFIGTDSAGDDFGNVTGVSISTTGNTVGGTSCRLLQRYWLQHGLRRFDFRNCQPHCRRLYRNELGRVNLINPVGISVSDHWKYNRRNAASAANVIGFSSTAGVSMRANDNLVIGNFVGTDSSGDDLGNATGVSVSATGNDDRRDSLRVRQHDRLQHISGVSISGADNLIAGNFIGTNSAGANRSIRWALCERGRQYNWRDCSLRRQCHRIRLDGRHLDHRSQLLRNRRHRQLDWHHLD